MKLPTVAPASAFAAGILLGLQPFFAARASSRAALLLALIILSMAISTGTLLALRNKLLAAALFSLAAWLGLGIFAALLSQQPPRPTTS
jgi:hypothetical protein